MRKPTERQKHAAFEWLRNMALQEGTPGWKHAAVLMVEIKALKESAPPEGARMKWLEDNCTLHRSVEILYVVDGYEVQVMHEDGVTALSPAFHGPTLGEAIDAAMLHAPQSSTSEKP